MTKTEYASSADCRWSAAVCILLILGACGESSLRLSPDSGISSDGGSIGGGGLIGSGGVTATGDSDGIEGARGGSGASGNGRDTGQGGSTGQSGGASGSTGPSGSGGKSDGTEVGAGGSGGNGGTANLGRGGNEAGGRGGTGGSSTGGGGTGGKSTGGGGGGGSGVGGGGTRGGGNVGIGTGVSNTGGNGLGGSGTAGDRPGGSGGSAGSTGAFLVTLANAFCTAARSCCAKSGLSTTLTDCETMFPSRIPAIAFVNQGTETVDGAALASCIAAYNQTATTCTFAPLVSACKGVFVGTKAEGTSCGVGGVPMISGSGECKTSGGAELCVWTGDVNVSTASGVCKAPVRGKSGDPCATSCAIRQDCTTDLIASLSTPTTVCFEADGLYCTSSTSVCAPIVVVGDSCADDSFSCTSTSYCDSSGATPTCRAAGTLGQACGTAGSMCLGSLVCGTDNKCDDPGFAFNSTCSGIPPYPY